MSEPAKDGLKLTQQERRGYGDKIRAFLRAERVSLLCELHLAAEHPVAIFTGGQPGSGKSTTVVSSLGGRFIDTNGIAVVDPDGLRELFPESVLERENGGGRYSDDALAGSGTLAHEICMSLAEARRHFIHEGTLVSLEFAGPEMDALRALGYAVEVHAVAVYPPVSLARTVLRSELEALDSPHGFGRTVPKAVHDGMAAKIPDSLDKLWRDGRVDRIVIYSRHGTALFDHSLADGSWAPAPGSASVGESPGAVVRRAHAEPAAEELLQALSLWLEAVERTHSSHRPRAASAESPVLAAAEVLEAARRVIGHEAARALLDGDPALRSRALGYLPEAG